MMNNEVVAVTVCQKLRTYKSCQFVCELLLQQVLFLAYYGIVIAQTGPWSVTRPPPQPSQVTLVPLSRLAFCSTSPAEMSSPPSFPLLPPAPSKLCEDVAPTQLFSPELTYIKHKRQVYMKDAQSAGI